MTTAAIKDVYRVTLGEGVFRSGEALAAMLVRDIKGVEVVAVNTEGALIALAAGDSDLYEDIVRAVVTAGFDPESVVATPFERLTERVPLTLAEAVAFGAPEPAVEPVRVPVETVRVQRVRIEVTDGYYPAHIVVTAGVPVEITFTEGHGCLAEVVFEDLGVRADLTSGGAVVNLPALESGVHPFSCGMHMVHGSITAE
jgi:hypothetical protein